MAGRQVARRLLQSGHTVCETARLVGVTRRTIQRWCQVSFAAPRQMCGGRESRLTPLIEAVVRKYISEYPTCTQDQLCQQVKHITGVSVSQATMSRWLRHRLKITRKVAVRTNTEIQLPRVASARLQFASTMRSLRGVWRTYFNVDESGWHLNRCGKYGWAPRGKRVVVWRPVARGQRFTLVLVVGIAYDTKLSAEGTHAGSGVVAWQLVAGSMTGLLFQQFVSSLSLPRGSHLVMDNARIHHAVQSLTRLGVPSIRATLDMQGVQPVYLPPYSPDLAPVELIFNRMRTFVDQREPRTEGQLRDAIQEFAANLTSVNVLDTYHHAWG